jgi:hypothetical protein
MLFFDGRGIDEAVLMVGFILLFVVTGLGL